MKIIKYIAAIIFFVAVNNVKAAPADLHSAINNVYKSYLDIKNALANDNSKAANSAAKKFTEALKSIPADQMDAKQKTVWAKYSEKLRFDGEHISESTAISHQREHFGSLSANMYEVVKAIQTNDMVLYKQYCPMEKKSWISETQEIKNPYLGSTMLDCGSTKETIKATK